MKKTLSRVIPLMIVLAIFVACQKQELPNDFSADAVKTTAGNAITEFSAENYTAFLDMCQDDLKGELPEESLAKVKNNVLQNSELKEVSVKSITGAKYKGEDIVVVVAVGKYSDKKATYTISLDKNSKLCGFYIK